MHPPTLIYYQVLSLSYPPLKILTQEHWRPLVRLNSFLEKPFLQWYCLEQAVTRVPGVQAKITIYNHKQIHLFDAWAATLWTSVSTFQAYQSRKRMLTPSSSSTKSYLILNSCKQLANKATFKLNIILLKHGAEKQNKLNCATNKLQRGQNNYSGRPPTILVWRECPAKPVSQIAGNVPTSTLKEKENTQIMQALIFHNINHRPSHLQQFTKARWTTVFVRKAPHIWTRHNPNLLHKTTRQQLRNQSS